MKYQIAKVWFSTTSQKFFGITHNYHDLIVDEHKEVVLDKIQTYYSTPIKWVHDNLTDTTRGWIK